MSRIPKKIYTGAKPRDFERENIIWKTFYFFSSDFVALSNALVNNTECFFHTKEFSDFFSLSTLLF
jgi:hypothetical protein